MDKKVQYILACMARVNFWDIKKCPFCGKKYNEEFEILAHEASCPVTMARQVLEEQGVWV